MSQHVVHCGVCVNQGYPTTAVQITQVRTDSTHALHIHYRCGRGHGWYEGYGPMSVWTVVGRGIAPASEDVIQSKMHPGEFDYAREIELSNREVSLAGSSYPDHLTFRGIDYVKQSLAEQAVKDAVHGTEAAYSEAAAGTESAASAAVHRIDALVELSVQECHEQMRQLELFIRNRFQRTTAESLRTTVEHTIAVINALEQQTLDLQSDKEHLVATVEEATGTLNREVSMRDTDIQAAYAENERLHTELGKTYAGVQEGELLHHDSMYIRSDVVERRTQKAVDETRKWTTDIYQPVLNVAKDAAGLVSRMVNGHAVEAEDLIDLRDRMYRICWPGETAPPVSEYTNRVLERHGVRNEAIIITMRDLIALIHTLSPGDQYGTPPLPSGAKEVLERADRLLRGWTPTPHNPAYSGEFPAGNATRVKIPEVDTALEFAWRAQHLLSDMNKSMGSTTSGVWSSRIREVLAVATRDDTTPPEIIHLRGQTYTRATPQLLRTHETAFVREARKTIAAMIAAYDGLAQHSGVQFQGKDWLAKLQLLMQQLDYVDSNVIEPKRTLLGIVVKFLENAGRSRCTDIETAEYAELAQRVAAEFEV